MNQKNASSRLRNLKNKDFRIDDAALTVAIVCVVYTMFICIASLA